MTTTHQQRARNSTTSARDGHETIFDLESLREELAHPDERRWKPAKKAMFWLSRLAGYRASLDGVAREAAWAGIFDTSRLQADLESRDEKLRTLAHRVLVQVGSVAAVREVLDAAEPRPIERQVRAIARGIAAREHANAIARANGEPEVVYTLN